ncbi:hypothetical protein F443_09452 [Plasmopara halstedii]|uniref:Nucleotide-diphospho-sugar transferase domain-containing protein n=1 Tax=Plasmopara halstedii TaxID=4781 RepID=A0A0P1B3H9_PLAHL|nr:hypothetical protein F443_09452 [Plasmopara halstedii]CEG48521.1 hypothetical protein F443_09452 [Plasmopara halstedii]|eukprot:XP_024584890.1 hypothetical protein F443_09452 [Plasmopara halstedii]
MATLQSASLTFADIVAYNKHPFSCKVGVLQKLLELLYLLIKRRLFVSVPENANFSNAASTENRETVTSPDNFSISDINVMEKQLVYSIHQIAQRTTEKRGIVLPLFNAIASLGLSLILELRVMGVNLPIEVPHCGDLDERLQRIVLGKEEMGVIRFYDVCKLAAKAVSFKDSSRQVFCENLYSCHRTFRSFSIKVLAVTYSQFGELMLLDADTIFFESPMSLWDTEKYGKTGTLFFHDRLSQDEMYLGKRIDNKMAVSQLNQYISHFDVSPFAPLSHIERPKATSKNKIPVKLNKYSPSEHLLSSHSWNQRAGHEMDSSLVLWNKKRQPRATAMLAAFVALNHINWPPSYGEKELFFIAAELAETQYAFSDFGVGSVGWDFRDYGPGMSVLCGHAAHFYPVKPADGSAVGNTSVLYLNSDAILTYDPKNKPVYYSQARLYEVYPGSFEERNLAQECPFNITGVRFSSKQEDHILLRQRFHEIAKAWIE